jgi:uncharacterized membrane protein YjdF
MNKRLLTLAFILVVLMGAVHFFASFFYLYWIVWWFDNVSHFLGGLMTGVLAFWALRRFVFRSYVLNFRGILTIILASVLVVGVGWEVFEKVFDIAGGVPGESYMKDTTIDLIADLLGGVVASILVYKNKLHV